MKSTNYHNAFIEVAEDCPVQTAEIPPQRGDKLSVANYQFDMIHNTPYQYTSDEIIFKIHVIRKETPKNFLNEEKENFFSKGQPCFRASTLAKRYGWGFHYNEEGKVAIYPVESQEYQQFLNDETLEHRKAMRSKRK